jgi:hypothetical protein
VRMCGLTFAAPGQTHSREVIERSLPNGKGMIEKLNSPTNLVAAVVKLRVNHLYLFFRPIELVPAGSFEILKMVRAERFGYLVLLVEPFAEVNQLASL